MAYDKRFPPGKILGEIDEMEWLDKSPLTGQTTIYPRSITFLDIDQAVFEWFNSREIVIDGDLVPAFFLTPEKWAEFKLQWEYMDGEKQEYE